jgi:hypothetical protein
MAMTISPPLTNNASNMKALLTEKCAILTGL